MSVIGNRLEKNFKKLKGWAKQAGISAYRLYDRDIPEYQAIVDVYNDFFVVYDKGNPDMARDQQHLEETVQQLQERFKVDSSKIILKKRFLRDNKTEQYSKLDSKGDSIVVNEGAVKYRVNLWDYLDTGLFLDHRPIRQQFAKAKFKGPMLNLFCYTGSVSVAAAHAGLATTSVDMSKTYLAWAEANFLENGLDVSKHRFIQEDVLQFLAAGGTGQKYETIFLDPPTFSNSKRMEGDFDVERDQVFLVEKCMALLNPGGVLIFSNNKRKFRLEKSLETRFQIRDITTQTIPPDFHDQKIHHCFEIRFTSP